MSQQQLNLFPALPLAPTAEPHSGPRPAPPQLREAAAAYVGPLPTKEQPVERLHWAGPTSLSSAELVAVLLGDKHTLDAQRLLATFKNIPGLARASTSELARQNGVGRATAARIKAAFELGRRLLAPPEPMQRVRSPADAAQVLMSEMSLLEKEELRVILLNTRNQVLQVVTVYVGSINSNLVRIGEVFKPAVDHYAAAIIVAHNHPSGTPDPSPEDVLVTKKLVQAGQLLDIEVLDHLVIGRNRFVSLKEKGLGFN